MLNILKRFKVNSIKLNPEKIQFMILHKSTRQSIRQSIILNINNIKSRESSSVVLLGLTLHNRLLRNVLIYYSVDLVSRKYLTTEAKLLYNAFINRQFNYVPIIWIFCHKQDYLKIEKIQYKALKIVYNSNESYKDLFLLNNEVSIHQKQLRILATEVFKSLADVNPDFIKSYFTIKEIPYCL